MIVSINIRGMESLIGGPQALPLHSDWRYVQSITAQRLSDIQIVATATDKAKKSRHHSRDFFLTICET